MVLAAVVLAFGTGDLSIMATLSQLLGAFAITAAVALVAATVAGFRVGETLRKTIATVFEVKRSLADRSAARWCGFASSRSGS